MNAKLFTWCLREICRQCYRFNDLSHMCAYSAILRLKIINKNLSRWSSPGDRAEQDTTWHLGRVALSEIIPHTDFRRGDVVQQPPISRSYQGYCTYRIYIGEWLDRYGYMYIFIFPRARQEITGETFFFLFFFPQSKLLKDMCILLLMKPAFYFWTYFLFKHLFGFLQIHYIITYSLDIFHSRLWIHAICSETGWSAAHTLLNTA